MRVVQKRLTTAICSLLDLKSTIWNVNVPAESSVDGFMGFGLAMIESNGMGGIGVLMLYMPQEEFVVIPSIIIA